MHDAPLTPLDDLEALRRENQRLREHLYNILKLNLRNQELLASNRGPLDQLASRLYTWHQSGEVSDGAYKQILETLKHINFL